VIGSVVVAAVIGLLGFGLKLYLAFRKKSVQALADTDHRMMQDAVDRPSDIDDAVDRL